MRDYRPRRQAVRRVVALSVAVAMASPCATAFATPQDKGRINLTAALNKRTLLLFPFDTKDAGIGNGGEVSSLLTDQAASRLQIAGAYSVIPFHRSLAPVARLHADQQITDADVGEPFAEDNVKATKITKLVGYDLAFVGRIDAYEFDAAKKQATITVSGRLLEMATGRILKSATLSGQSGSGGSAKEEERAMDAARAAGEKLLAQLVPVVLQPTTTVTPVKQTGAKTGKRRGGGSGWLWGLLAVGLGLGIGLSGGGGGGGSADVPPPPP